MIGILIRKMVVTPKQTLVIHFLDGTTYRHRLGATPRGARLYNTKQDNKNCARNCWYASLVENGTGSLTSAGRKTVDRDGICFYKRNRCASGTGQHNSVA